MCSDILSSIAGERPYAVKAMASRLGDDIVVTVGGGSLHHVGAVSLAQYEPFRDSASVSTITVFSHRDDAVAAFFAKAISREMKCTVSVSAGLHVDDASEADIKCLWNNAVECCERLIAMLKCSEEQ